MTDPSQSLTLAEWFALFGVKLATLIAGFAGAALPIMSGLLLHLDASAAGTLAAPSISQCPDRRTT